MAVRFTNAPLAPTGIKAKPTMDVGFALFASSRASFSSDVFDRKAFFPLITPWLFVAGLLVGMYRLPVIVENLEYRSRCLRQQQLCLLKYIRDAVTVC